MLDQLKLQLKELASLPVNTFADHAVKQPPEPLRAFILVIPEMVEQVRAWMENPQTPASLKELHGFMMTYLYHPTDYIPEDNKDLFGYLDDAYVIGSIYYRFYSEIGYVHRRHLPHMEEISAQLPQWLRLTEEILPTQTRKISGMLDELRQGNPAGFQAMMEENDRRIG